MTEEKIKEKAQKVQADLLEAVLNFYQANPNDFFGSKKVTDRLELLEGFKFWFVHGILEELKKRGHLIQKKGSGFRLKRQKIKETR